MAIKLKYGNTNTYFLPSKAGVLVDTDMAGTLPAFYREIKKCGIAINDIGYVIATHYHPDHMGLISELTALGVRLLLAEHQRNFVHFSDKIFNRSPSLRYCPIREEEAVLFSCDESRQLLSSLGIQGEIVPTRSHSEDGIALISDDGSCFVGDLEPMDYVEAYPDNPLLRDDWERIMACHPRTIYYGHANEKRL